MDIITKIVKDALESGEDPVQAVYDYCDECGSMTPVSYSAAEMIVVMIKRTLENPNDTV